VSDKSEIENLFLDCVDEQKREIIKKRASGLILPPATTKLLKYSDPYKSGSGDEEDSLMTIDQVVNSKESLIAVFELMFGSGANKGKTIKNVKGGHSLVANDPLKKSSYYGSENDKNANNSISFIDKNYVAGKD
jgi:hypothetical protein